MVVGAFPIAKLGALILRQVSKPIAEFAKQRAKQSPFFRTYICMPPAQLYNWCEVKMKMWVLNLGKPVVVPSLNEAMAIELGANLLGEFIIFSIASGLLIMEYVRQVRKETAKEAAREEEMTNLTSTIQELYFQAERQDAQLREMERTILELQSRVRSPWKPMSPPNTPSSGGGGGIDVSSNLKKIHYHFYQPDHSGLVTNALHYLSINFMPQDRYND